MADWPVLVVILLIPSGFAAVALLAFYGGGRHVVRKVRSRRDLAAATAARKAVSLPPFPMAAHSAPSRPLVPAAPPSQLITPTTPGRHSHEHLRLDSPTERLVAVPGPAQPATPVRGHRAATPDRPANAPHASDSGGHRALHGQPATVAGARLTTG